MNFFKRRQYKKMITHILHSSKHARYMREDISSLEDIEQLKQLESSLKDSWKLKDPALIDQQIDTISTSIDKIYPTRSNSFIREHIEILAIALTIAMACRTFVIQPFKIPTGSMQPTLYGITANSRFGKRITDHFPLKLIRMIIMGERYVEVYASASGRVDKKIVPKDNAFIVSVNGVPQKPIQKGMKIYFKLDEYVQKGQLLASGDITIGDHIFVNKIKYHFMRPKRGDIIVFDTEGIEHPRIRQNTFYIKRCVGIPGDEVQIHPPYLVINGDSMDDTHPFKKIMRDIDLGYNGYILAEYNQYPKPKLTAESDTISLGEGEYLPFGDNTRSSLDGRYFGSVYKTHLVGPAFAVYWPFIRRSYNKEKLTLNVKFAR
jgi:signal peptidase I